MMSLRERRHLIVDSTLHPDPQIGAWLWALEDARSRTNEILDTLGSANVDWRPPEGTHTIGTILYHTALIEADWLYAEVLEQSLPAERARLFPYDVRSDEGMLTVIHGWSLAEHRDRLAQVRCWLLDVYQAMDLAEFRRVRRLPRYDVTPEWVLHHLMQHEAEHRGELAALSASMKQ